MKLQFVVFFTLFNVNLVQLLLYITVEFFFQSYFSWFVLSQALTMSSVSVTMIGHVTSTTSFLGK